MNDVESAIQHIYPLVHEFRKQRSAEELQHLRQKHRAQGVGSGGDDFSEQDQPLTSEGKTQSKDDLLSSTSAAHTNASPSLSSASIYATRRVEQFKGYQQVQEQSQLERRNLASSSSGGGNSSGGDNICANARRRATECWATKLQNKRSRYNDPGSTATGSTIVMGRTSCSGGSSSTIVSSSYSANFSAVGVAGSTASATATATTQLRLSRPFLPVDVILKQNSSRARNATTIGAISGEDGLYSKRETFSPTDFQVDDLIEEDDDDVYMQF